MKRLQTFGRRLREIFWDSETAQIECLSGLLYLSWVPTILFPNENLAQSESYTVLMEVFPAWVWAIAFLVLGLSTLIALFVNKLTWRRDAALLAVLLWTFMAVTRVVASTSPSAVGVYLVLAVLSAFIFLRWSARIRKLRIQKPLIEVANE
jgi:hypothetical protein